MRNLRETFNLFAPTALPRAEFAIAVLVLFVGTVVWAAADRRGAGRRVERPVPSLGLVVMLALGMIAGRRGTVPLRRRDAPPVPALAFRDPRRVRCFRRSPPPRGVAGMAKDPHRPCLAAIGANFALRVPTLAHPAPYRIPAPRRILLAGLSDVGVVNVDQFNLIGLFSAYADWDWRFIGTDSDSHRVERYELRRDSRHLTVVAFRGWWIFDLESPALYGELRDAFERAPEPCQPVLRISGTVFDRPDAPEGIRPDPEKPRGADRQPRLPAGPGGPEARPDGISRSLGRVLCPPGSDRCRPIFALPFLMPREWRNWQTRGT